MDLIKKNRWKDMEMMGTNKGLWILSSIMYLYIDYLFMLTAFVSSDKVFSYLKQQDDEHEKRIKALNKKGNVFTDPPPIDRLYTESHNGEGDV